MQKYNKAIVAVLGGLVTLFAPAIPAIAEAATPEVIQSLSTLITAVMVYAIPNNEA
ncbi:MAG: hypothetical protein AB8G17_06575 [Gammaproteobacteria bacterium]